MSGNTEASGDKTTDTLDEGKIRADATATATADVQARIKSILGCEHASNCPKMANHLAFETSASAEEAIALMAVASEDLEAAKAEKSTDDDTSYEGRKTEAGTLGLGIPDAPDGDKQEARSGWGKSVAKVNGRSAKA